MRHTRTPSRPCTCVISPPGGQRCSRGSHMVWSCFPNPKLNVSLYAMHAGECGEGSAPAGIVGECHLSGLRDFTRQLASR